MAEDRVSDVNHAQDEDTVEDGSNMSLQNLCEFIPDDMVSQPGR
jgi:hypothetical protein